MPGNRVPAAVFLAEPLSKTAASARSPQASAFLAETLSNTFTTGTRTASYTGLAPLTRRPGSSIRG